jgi:hypothetical protein
MIKESAHWQGCQMVYFRTKCPNFGKFWGTWNGKCWYILWTFGIYYGHLEYVYYGHLEYNTAIWNMYITVIWYTYFRAIWKSGIRIFPVLVYCKKTNLATLLTGRVRWAKMHFFVFCSFQFVKMIEHVSRNWVLLTQRLSHVESDQTFLLDETGLKLLFRSTSFNLRFATHYQNI